MKRRGLHPLASVATLVIISTIAVLLIYMWTVRATSPKTDIAAKRAIIGEALKIEGTEAKPGFLVLYTHCIGFPCLIDRAYIFDTSGRLVTSIPIMPPERIPPGTTAPVPIPLLLLPNTIIGENKLVIKLAGRSGVASAPVSIEALSASASLTIGLLADRTPVCDVGDLAVSPNYIHWLYINILTGDYMFRYINGNEILDASGRARVFVSKDTLDLSSMSWSQRYDLGPVVIFINPYRAAQPYAVKVVDVNGYTHVFEMTPLTNNPNEVGIDALLLWEDQWWPNTPYGLDNYIDHVIRFTAFLNGTVRIEVMHASGCYLHMLLYKPGGLPDFNSVPSIVQEFAQNSYTLPASAGVDYVKSHGAEVPPPDPNDIWDPVNEEWITNWPVAWYVRVG